VALLALRAAVVKPQTGATLVLLRVRGEDGLTPDQARRWAGTDRLAARVAELRAEGHDIETVRETVRGKTFARYVLRERPAYADWSPGELQEAFGK
jgi:hypothetical protein